MVKNTKVFGLVLTFLIVLSVLAIVPIASANTDLQVNYLKIDGEVLDSTATGGLTLEVKRGENLPIRVRVSAVNNDIKDVQVSAGIYGYQYSQYESSKIYDISNAFDLDAGDTKNVDLNLNIPTKMDSQDMKLRIMVADRDSPNAYIKEYELDVKGISRDKAVVIKEAYLNPSNKVMAGRALSALVKVKNIGSDDLGDGVTLTVSVPELNIRDTETLDKLDADETQTFEKTILRFPSDAKPGNYEVDYTIKFDEYESVTKTDVVTVTPCQSVTCGAAKPKNEGTTVIQIPKTQVVYQSGAESVYPLMINNMGDSSKAYTIAVSGVDAWGTSRVDPGSSIVIPAKSTATVFLYVAANDKTTAGEKYFKVTVGTDGDVKEIPLSAQVKASENNSSTNSNDWSGLKKTLEVALIILVIILILIGLIVGFNKLRGSGNDDDEDAKTYY